MLNNIFEIEELHYLEQYLLSLQIEKEKLREELFSEFLQYSKYKNATEWNRAVRLCESLAIVGWGRHEPLQAVRGQFYNGNPMTSFCNKFRLPRFVDAIWSKRKEGYTMEQERTSYITSPDHPEAENLWKYPVIEDIQDVKLQNQRNWIPRCPILLSRIISNCYPESKAVIDSIKDDLQTKLDQEMRPELYGRSIDCLIFNCSYSYYDHNHCKTNYIIADNSLKLKQKDFYPQLLTMYSEKEIQANGYYLRNRYEYGPFRNGVARTSIHFEKGLKDMSNLQQKEEIAKHISTAADSMINKLKKKGMNYNFDLMQSDFLTLLSDWKVRDID